jgi:drug/metabolite transporter (DMT)-like permease
VLQFLHRGFEWAGRSAWLLLLLTMFFWSCNVPVSRLAVGEVSPMTIVCARWAIGLVLLGTFVPRRVWTEVLSLRSRWRFLLLMGFAMTASNSCIFLAAKYTTGVNLAILQGVTPVFVLAGAALLHRTPVSTMQAFGVLLTLFGVALVATQGAPLTILGLHLNRGDIYMLTSVAIYSGYIIALRDKPAVSSLALFTVIALVSFVTSIPLLAIEYAAGYSFAPTWKGIAALIYVAIFTSILGHLFFIRSVELIGPSRAAIFGNLTPVFGAVLSVIVLGEALMGYHLLALLLVMVGIFICEHFELRARRKTQV